MQGSLKEKTELTFQKILKMKISVIHMPQEELQQYLKGLKLYKKQQQGHIKGIEFELDFKRKHDRKYIQREQETEGIITKLKRLFKSYTKKSTNDQQQTTTQDTQTTQINDKNGYTALPVEEVQLQNRVFLANQNKNNNTETAESHQSIAEKKTV